MRGEVLVLSYSNSSQKDCQEVDLEQKRTQNFQILDETISYRKRCVSVSRSAECFQKGRVQTNAAEDKKVFVENGLEKIECLKMLIGGLSCSAAERPYGAFTG